MTSLFKIYKIKFLDCSNKIHEGKMKCCFVNDDEHGHAMVKATLALTGYTLLSIE